VTDGIVILMEYAGVQVRYTKIYFTNFKTMFHPEQIFIKAMGVIKGETILLPGGEND